MHNHVVDVGQYRAYVQCIETPKTDTARSRRAGLANSSARKPEQRLQQHLRRRCPAFDQRVNKQRLLKLIPWA